MRNVIVIGLAVLVSTAFADAHGRRVVARHGPAFSGVVVIGGGPYWRGAPYRFRDFGPYGGYAPYGYVVGPRGRLRPITPPRVFHFHGPYGGYPAYARGVTPFSARPVPPGRHYRQGVVASVTRLFRQDRFGSATIPAGVRYDVTLHSGETLSVTLDDRYPRVDAGQAVALGRQGGVVSLFPAH